MNRQNGKPRRIVLRSVAFMLLFAMLSCLISLPARADETSSVPEESSTVTEETASPAPEESTAVPPEETTTEPSEETTSVPPEETTAEPSEETTTVPPEETTTEPPEETTTEPPEPPGPELPVTVLYGPFAFDGIPADLPVVIVTGLVVNVRSGAGTENDVVAFVRRQQVFEYLGTEKDSDGKDWYQVKIPYEQWELTGYIAATMSKRETLSAAGDVYANYLRLLGFPGSYVDLMVILHRTYPSWVFLCTDTGQEWGTALYEEANPSNYLGISLIHTSSISSWKSMKYSNFDYAANKWKTSYDGPAWTLASDELVAYFLDPRNFINPDGIYMFLNLQYDETQTVAGIQAIVQDTFLAGSVTDVDGTSFSYPQKLYDIGLSLGVSPYYLACTIRQEIGTAGTSKSISGKSTTVTPGGVSLWGYFNYYNVYAFTSMGMDANDVGLWFASGQDKGYTTYNRPWNTRLRALVGGAQYHAYNYILNYQNTLYYKKFNVVPGNGTPFRHQYMTNVMGAYSESRNLVRAYASLGTDQVLCFDIPVFSGMPSEAAPKPTRDGSPNNRLQSLTAGGACVPVLNMTDQNYSMAVSSASLQLKAIPVDSTAKVSGDGTIALQEGENTVTLTVTAGNGDVRTYTLNIYREKASAPMLVSTDLTIKDGSISGIEPGTAVSDLLPHVKTGDGAAVRIVDADGKEKTSGRAATGDRLQIVAKNGGVLSDTPLLIYGDVNGDGKINIADLITIRDQILGDYDLKGVQRTAANVNFDKKINIVDLITIRDQILGDYVIPQKGE